MRRLTEIKSFYLSHLHPFLSFLNFQLTIINIMYDHIMNFVKRVAGVV
jgi:hypothetical protein